MHAFFCAVSFVTGTPIRHHRSLTRSLLLVPRDTRRTVGEDERAVRRRGRVAQCQAVRAALIAEIMDDDDEDDEDGDLDDDDDGSGSENSFLPGGSRSRSRSRGSSLPTSRKPSPMPQRLDGAPSSLYGRFSNAVGGLLGTQKRKNSMRGEYNSLGGGEQ